MENLEIRNGSGDWRGRIAFASWVDNGIVDRIFSVGQRLMQPTATRHFEQTRVLTWIGPGSGGERPEEHQGPGIQGR